MHLKLHNRKKKEEVEWCVYFNYFLYTYMYINDGFCDVRISMEGIALFLRMLQKEKMCFYNTLKK